MRTVIEFTEFITKAGREFGEEERENIVSFLSLNPKAGKALENFGGIRKIEWQGRRNSEYNIYFHPGTKNLPLVIISMFKKGEKLILSKLIEVLIYSKTA